MARRARLCIAGQAHHLTQRSIEGQPAFVDDADRQAYLADLRLAARASEVTLQGYVLMSDHVHIVATPSRADGLGKLMQRTGRRYVAGFNQRHRRKGALWEGRFAASVLDPEHFVLSCLTHMELSPLRHRLVANPEDWHWSSAAHHLGLCGDPMLVDPPAYWRLGNTPFERESAYRRLLTDARTDDPAARRFREVSRRGGRAAGSDSLWRQVAPLSATPVSAESGPRPSANGNLSPRIIETLVSDP